MNSTCISLLVLIIAIIAPHAWADEPPKTIRIATYNVSLFRNADGELASDLAAGVNPQARNLAQVIQSVRPDVLLLNEIDHESDHAALNHFVHKYLAQDSNATKAIDFPYTFAAPSNTGEPSGLDLDRDGVDDTPGDAWGFGRYPGQYGMAVLSRFPIDEEAVRTFRLLKWSNMPGARRPVDPATGESWYSDAEWQQLRLSSKSHWDVPIVVPGLGTLHLLASHPTPPVFDGPEDRNGCRNHDEIRLWADYVSTASPDYLIDDAGRRGGIAADAPFVIAGDLNCDPIDGDSAPVGIRQLLDHPRINASIVPSSKGGVEAARRNRKLNETHRGDPAHDTADFSGDDHGNLRVDYVLPSNDLKVVKSGIFWPASDEAGSQAITATDHRLVWIEISVTATPTPDEPIIP